MDVALVAFLEAYLGVANTGNTAGNKGQCVGLVEVWLDYNKKPHIDGNAVDLLNNAQPAAYNVTRNGPNNFPPPGAVVCWDGTWGGGYGHTAIVVAANPMELVVFEQNDPTGNPPMVATHSYGGVAGWITFK